ncbi:hypothetical protein [Actinomyces ruminis]|uniref:Integral membrane protein n=1 Tax=Actinomyces ruminis TaxID=1937003 RepID=A0ABX4MCS3_9ACTO|nr:hypothetical protein [Actinomyces ruminis]PHP53294.1 hypothetical protein BW737_003810 [Actinomyces ruminis]
MNPGILLGIVVNVLFGALFVTAIALPWTRFGHGTGRGARVLATVVAAVMVGITWSYTLADVQTTGPGGGAVWCGSSCAFMLDPRLQKFEGLPRECIVHSWIAVAVLFALAVATLVAQRYVLRLVARRRRH